MPVIGIPAGIDENIYFVEERTHNAGAVRQKACRSRPASMLPVTGSPAAGENRVGNTKHLISVVRAHTVPAAGSRFQSTHNKPFTGNPVVGIPVTGTVCP
ncbi:hypothetical protein J6590_088098 [Homalodisca vitripennis]|nr:hypothetical protein J6590_088098 [Homalodisca vitripennis]